MDHREYRADGWAEETVNETIEANIHECQRLAVQGIAYEIGIS
jgi:hypothetical protein